MKDLNNISTHWVKNFFKKCHIHFFCEDYSDLTSPTSNQILDIYYPNLVILPVDNNEHQRIDDVSTDRISYDIRSIETMGFAL